MTTPSRPATTPGGGAVRLYCGEPPAMSEACMPRAFRAGSTPSPIVRRLKIVAPVREVEKRRGLHVAQVSKFSASEGSLA
ncbi:MAG TPA: hypothetical protein VHC19_05265, partial [Pirellulales bacterium]|nr:hypothetical protein [Pirellulales bacterium]